ncbi:MAG: BTAD domain-containing putative transcriptional regulator [Terracoccus sp.]
MHFRLLGPVEVEASGTTLPLGSARQRLVLALLLLATDRLTSADHLIGTIWDSPPPTARQQLQNIIAGLRRRLGAVDPQLIVTRPFGYELRLGEHTLDVSQFRQRSREATELQADADLGPARHALEAALDLWRGEALADVPEGVEIELRQSLADERRATLELLLDVLHRAGRPDDVLARVAGPLTDDPWNERLHAHRIRALASAGRRSEAIEAFLSLRRTLIDELGVGPSAALVELNEQIVAGQVDLGGAGPADRAVPRELPAPSWSLIGREALVESVVSAVTGRPGEAPGPEDAPTTVVLAGAGGAGKSAVAVTAGHRLGAAHPDGTLWIPVGGQPPAGPAGPTEALGRALRSLGVAPRAVPADLEGRVSLYRSTLATRRVLVVIDGATSESQVRPLLPATPGSAAVITSRRKLAGLVGATRFTVPPLDPAASASLVTALAGAQRPTAEPGGIARISALCGHLPLALCVVGARLAANEHLGLGDLIARLEREHARLDELATGDIDVRASIMTSVSGLSAPARTLFERLSLGPRADWPGWVAQQLAGTRTWLRDLDELVDLHLVEPTGRDAAGQPRFRILGPVAELSAELLAGGPSGDGAGSPCSTADSDAVLRLLTRWEQLAAAADLALARPGANDATRSPERGDGTDLAPAANAPREWFEIERGNLVTAVLAVQADRCEGPGRVASTEAVAIAIRLGLHLRDFLTIRAHDVDRERVLRHVLGLLPPAADPALEVEVLHSLFAALAQRQSFEELPAIAQRQLDAARRVGDHVSEARALNQAGWAAQSLDRFAEAATWFDRAARLAEQHDDPLSLATARGQTGVVLRNAGRAAEADPLLAQMVDHVRTHGSPRSTCIWLVTRAEGLIDLGLLTEADALLLEAVDLATALDDGLGLAHCRLARATVLVHRGALRAAAAELAPALAVLDRHAAGGVDPEALRLRAEIADADGNLVLALDLTRQAVTVQRARGSRIELARDLSRWARARARIETSGDTRREVDHDTDPGTQQHTDADAEVEVEAILADLGLDRRALRLPAAWGPEGTPPELR